MGNTPSFIIVGAQKSGTTSLYHWLNQHPQISMSQSEEPHYFDREQDYPNLSWYLSQFIPNKAAQMGKPLKFGEKTPIYCYWPTAIARIHAFDPAMKLIMILRNPVDRAISQYWMGFQRGTETLSMKAAFAREQKRIQENGSVSLRHHSYLSRGYYYAQLARIYSFFTYEQVFVGRFEDLVKNPQLTMDEIFDFLEVASTQVGDLQPHRVGQYPDVNPQLRRELVDHFSPYNDLLSKGFGIHTDDWR